MFATLASTAWTQICRGAALLRMFALLEDAPRPVAARPHTTRPQPRRSFWEAHAPRARPMPRAHAGADRVPLGSSDARADRDTTTLPLHMTTINAPSEAALRQLALKHTHHPHPHSRRLVADHARRRPGSPPPAPMICLCPVAQPRPRRRDDRRR
jgi:hypothetical protein